MHNLNLNKEETIFLKARSNPAVRAGLDPASPTPLLAQSSNQLSNYCMHA